MEPLNHNPDLFDDPRRPRLAALTDGSEVRGAIEASSRAALLALPLVLLSGAAISYGLLDFAERHPSLKLGGAMALAGMAVLSLLLAGMGFERSKTPRLHSARKLIPHPLLLALGWLSLASAVVHFAVAAQHFDEYWLYGVFFVVASCAQVIFGVWAALQPDRMMLWAALALNGAIAAIWVLTRVYGALIGPDAAERAPVGFGDAVSTLFEVLIVVTAAILLARRPSDAARVHHPLQDVLNTTTAIGIAMLTSLALFSAVGGEPFVSHVG